MSTVLLPVRRTLAALAGLTGCVLLGACGSVPGQSAPGSNTSSAGGDATQQCSYEQSGQAARTVDLPKTSGVAETGTATFVLTTNEGPITITMDRSKTPCTINSFESLTRQNYYDNTTCHRLVDSGIFVLQCGDPTATGSGGPGYQFDDELSGQETYPAGTVAMANAGPNTNGSQFFLVYADSPLPADYTVFGTMDQAGLTVVNKIQAEGEDGSFAASGGGGKPNNPAKIISVVEK